MNQQPNCEIIRDLLPLYIDNACSPSSRALVEEHLASCAECRNIYDKMRTSMPDSIKQTGAKATPKQAFRSVRLHLLGIILAAAAVISCFVINIGGAWMGDPASLGSLAATLFYLLFWGVFTVLSRNYRPLTKRCFYRQPAHLYLCFQRPGLAAAGRGRFFRGPHCHICRRSLLWPDRFSRLDGGVRRLCGDFPVLAGLYGTEFAQAAEGNAAALKRDKDSYIIQMGTI